MRNASHVFGMPPAVTFPSICSSPGPCEASWSPAPAHGCGAPAGPRSRTAATAAQSPVGRVAGGPERLWTHRPRRPQRECVRPCKHDGCASNGVFPCGPALTVGSHVRGAGARANAAVVASSWDVALHVCHDVVARRGIVARRGFVALFMLAPRTRHAICRLLLCYSAIYYSIHSF